MKKLLVLMVLFIITFVSAQATEGESPVSLPSQDTNTGCRLITADYTLEEDYTANGDCLVIGSNNIILDGNGHTITGNGTGIGITAIGTTGITIKNFKIRGFKTSISIQDADNSIIENNDIVSTTDYSKGISSVSSDNVVFKDNSVVMESQESAGVYITSHTNMVFDANEVTCKGKLFFEKTACAHLTSISDSEIKNNKFEYKSGSFHIKGGCFKLSTGQNNKFHDNTITGYCPAITSSGESGSEYYNNTIETSGMYYGSYSRGFTFADGANNLIKDNEVSASAQVFNINTAYSQTSPAGYVVTNLKLDNGLLFSATKITQLNVYGSNTPNVVVPDYVNKTGLGKFGIYSYSNTPGYIEFSVKYDMEDEIDEGTIGLYYYYSNKWTLLPGTRVDKENNIIYVDYIKFPTTFSGNNLNLGVWGDAKKVEPEPEPTNLCQADCTKGDNITYLECESHEGCQDVQMNFLDPSGTEIVIADCDMKTLGSNYSFLNSYCIGSTIYEQYSCKQNEGVSGTIVNVNPKGRTCENGCKNGACADEFQNDTEPIEGTCQGNLILVCHRGNDPQTICVANASIAAHLDHGDNLGACTLGDEIQESETTELNNSAESEDAAEAEKEIKKEETIAETEGISAHGGCPPEKILICHLSKKEICISREALNTHKLHDDYEGYCIFETKEEEHLRTIEKDKKTEIKLSDGTISKIEFKTKNDKKDVRISVKTRNSAPTDVKKHERKVYNYITIDHPHISNEEISESIIEFTVEKSWVEANGRAEDVVLSKYNKTWRDLRTKYVRSDGKNHYFTADSEGFSEFAVNMLSTVADPIETVTKSTNIAKKPALENKLLAFAQKSWQIVLVLSVFSFVFLELKGGMKKKKETELKKERESLKILIEYVEDFKKKGMTVDDVKSSLFNAGWKKEDIDKVIKLTGKW